MKLRTKKIPSGRCLFSMLGMIGGLSLTISAGHAAAAPDRNQNADSKRSVAQASPTTKVDLAKQILRSLETADVAGAGWLPSAPSDEDYFVTEPAVVELGKLLFHDKILSGNMNTSCATCHHMTTDTSDGLSLPVGEGGIGVGPPRTTGFGIDAIVERVPRNAPHIFNIGAFEFDTMMHDGRIAADPDHPAGFLTPAGMDLMEGLDSVVAAQACFPVTSSTEMAGQLGENNVAKAVAAGDLPSVWAILAKRVQNIEEYVDLFVNAFPDVHDRSDITYTHIANSIAAYEFDVGRADNSPFDQFLRGDSGAMSMNAVQGMILFYGQAGCSDCHSGSFQTSQGFAAIGMPQIGPGKGHNQPGYSDGHDDLGLGAETGDPSDNFRFRIPSLRNVAITGPWTHAGAYNTLEAVVRHHLNPADSLLNYDQSQAVLPYRDDLSANDMIVMNDKNRVLGILAANELGVTMLTEDEIDSILDFLHSLTDVSSIDLRYAIPMRVPSGLPVYD